MSLRSFSFSSGMMTSKISARWYRGSVPNPALRRQEGHQVLQCGGEGRGSEHAIDDPGGAGQGCAFRDPARRDRQFRSSSGLLSGEARVEGDSAERLWMRDHGGCKMPGREDRPEAGQACEEGWSSHQQPVRSRASEDGQRSGVLCAVVGITLGALVEPLRPSGLSEMTPSCVYISRQPGLDRVGR